MSYSKLSVENFKPMYSPEKRDPVGPVGRVFGPAISVLHEFLTGAEKAQLEGATAGYEKKAIEARKSSAEWAERVHNSSWATHAALKASAEANALADCLLKPKS